MELIGYNDSPIKNFGSIIVFLCHGNEKYKILCEVADNSGHMVLGRDQALRMKYVDFPQIQEPTVNAKTENTIKDVQKEQVKTATKPVRPVIQQSRKSSITINDNIPTTHHKRIPAERVCKYF